MLLSLLLVLVSFTLVYISLHLSFALPLLLCLYVSHLLWRGQTTCFSTYDISQMNRRMQSTIHTTHDYITNSMFACMFLNIVHNYKPDPNLTHKIHVVHICCCCCCCCHQCHRRHHHHHLSSAVTLCLKAPQQHSTKTFRCRFRKLFNVIQIMTLILYAQVMKILLRLFICNNNHSLTRTVIK